MEEIIDFIKENKLVKPGEVIGVGVSGGYAGRACREAPGS